MSLYAASIAVKNPVIQKAAFEALTDEDERQHVQTSQTLNSQIVDGSVLNISEEELTKIRKWARILRLSMMAICTCLFIVSWYNFLSVSSSSFSTTFLAVYLFMFALLICCFECAFRQAALVIVQNFGFMYSFSGRAVFLVFVAILCYQISLFGKVMFGILLGYIILNFYVSFSHPMYNRYMRTLHFYNRTKSNKPPPQGPVSVV